MPNVSAVSNVSAMPNRISCAERIGIAEQTKTSVRMRGEYMGGSTTGVCYRLKIMEEKL